MSNDNSKRFIGNSAWMIGQQVYYLLITLIVGALSARYLGPSNYGLLNYGASIISFFTIICKLGLDSVIINEMIVNPDNQGKYLGSALIMRLVISVFSFFGIIAVIKILNPSDSILLIVTILQAFAVILQTYEVLTYWFQLTLKMKYVSLATMIAQTVVAVWRISLLSVGASIYWFALSSSLQFLVCGIVVFYCFEKQKEGSLHLSFSKDISKALLSKSYHFIISGLAVTMYTQIDKIMVGKIIDEKAVGIYTAASAIAVMWEFVPNALINSARPLIIQKRESDYNQYLRSFKQLLLGITLLFVLVGVAVSILSKYIILVLYGSEYLNATVPLSILIWSTGFAMIGSARGIWIVAEGYQKYTKYYVFIGAFVNFILNFYAITEWGILGASITTLISQMVVALVSPLFFKPTKIFVKLYFQSFKEMPVLINMIKEFSGRKYSNKIHD